MAARIMLTAVLAVGVPFDLGFLVAICKELRRVRIGYLVRLQPAAGEASVIELKQERKRHARAA